MRVKLKAHITGTRNGKEWPGHGEEMELPDDEAASLVAMGMAEEVGGKAQDEVSAPASARDALVPKRTVKGK